MTDFKNEINNIVISTFGKTNGSLILKSSDLIKYLIVKTKSANSSSKARGSFGNLYAIYVLVEDYLSKGFDKSNEYNNYAGATFSSLFTRQRQLPFGAKLQNHALNHRMNMEFKKICNTCEYTPILRDPKTNHYWFNEKLLKFDINGKNVCIANIVINIIDKYVQTKMDTFNQFILTCEQLKSIDNQNDSTIIDFIMQLIKPEMDVDEVKASVNGTLNFLKTLSPDEIRRDFSVYKTRRRGKIKKVLDKQRAVDIQLIQQKRIFRR